MPEEHFGIVEEEKGITAKVKELIKNLRVLRVFIALWNLVVIFLMIVYVVSSQKQWMRLNHCAISPSSHFQVLWRLGRAEKKRVYLGGVITLLCDSQLQHQQAFFPDSPYSCKAAISAQRPTENSELASSQCGPQKEIP